MGKTEAAGVDAARHITATVRTVMNAHLLLSSLHHLNSSQPLEGGGGRMKSLRSYLAAEGVLDWPELWETP